LQDDHVPAEGEGDGPAAERRRQLAEAIEVGRAREGIDEPALGVAHLDEPELRDVARDGGLDGRKALLAERIGNLFLRRERTLLDEAQDRALALELVHARTSWRIEIPWDSSSSRIVSGGVSRRTRSPAEQARRLRSRQALTISPAGRSRSRASSRPRPRASGNASRTSA